MKLPFRKRVEIVVWSVALLPALFFTVALNAWRTRHFPKPDKASEKPREYWESNR